SAEHRTGIKRDHGRFSFGQNRFIGSACLRIAVEVKLFNERGQHMKGLTLVGALLLVLGLLALVIPIPQKEDHGVKIGDAKIAVQTEHSERLPPVVGGLLVVGGVILLVAGARKSA